MPEVDYAVLSEWFDWITTNISIPVDLIGENAESWNTNTHLLKLTMIRNIVVEVALFLTDTHRNIENIENDVND